MLSDSGDRRQAASHKTGGAPPENEILPCPRCESSNTKFCYYNNYNLSQPRHFCKSCRRYWTQGGTLRNIPVGGGSRKNAKRSRTSSTVSSPENSHTPPISATPVSVHSSSVTSEKTDSSTLPLRFHDVDLNVSNVSGPFTSLLSTQGQGPPGGFLALGGFGLGLGSGFEEMGFELGRGVWPLEDVSEPDGGCGGGGNGGVSGETWHIGSGGGGHDHGGFSDGDCFSWPELAISTTVRGEKAA